MYRLRIIINKKARTKIVGLFAMVFCYVNISGIAKGAVFSEFA